MSDDTKQFNADWKAAEPAPAEPDPTQAAATPAPESAELAALRAELAELRKKQEARDYADAVAAGKPIEHPMTHVLVLANGEKVETTHASTTAVSFDNGDGTETVVPVVGCYEIRR